MPQPLPLTSCAASAVTSASLPSSVTPALFPCLSLGSNVPAAPYTTSYGFQCPLPQLSGQPWVLTPEI